MENQKLNKGADLYPAMDDLSTPGEPEVKTPNEGEPEPEENMEVDGGSDGDDTEPGTGTSIGGKAVSKDVRMRGIQPGSLSTNIGGDGGVGDQPGLSDTSGSTGSGFGNVSGSRE